MIKLPRNILFANLNVYTFMMLRTIKPNKIQATINKKLRSSNLITTLDLSSHKQFAQDLPITKSNKKNHQIRQQIRQPKQKKNQVIRSQHTKETVAQTKKHRKYEITEASTPKLEQALSTMGKALDPINTKQLNKIGLSEAALKQNELIEQAISDMKKLQLKDFSVLVHRMLVNSSGLANTVNKFMWKQIQQNFIQRFQVTTDPKIIRSYSKVLYSLAKSKSHKDTSSSTVSTSITTNLQSLQTKFALLLPSASHQSFSTIISSLSRLGPLSQQFCYITQRLYYSKYTQFNIRERIQINYALTRNNKMADSQLHNFIDSMNLNQILLMLRCYQNCGVLFSGLGHQEGVMVQSGMQENGERKINGKQILLKAEKNILLRKKQMNIIDISDICAIYFQAVSLGYQISKKFETMLTQMYEPLKKNMNQVAFQKIWRNLALVVNKGFLEVLFVEQLIKTLRIMRKNDVFPQRIWKPMRQSFRKFQNLELRARLQQIK